MSRFLAFQILLISLMSIGVSGASMADDGSMAVTPWGGLEFEKNSLISLREEYLKISLDYVDAEFLFENNTDKDAEFIVGFPLPIGESLTQDQKGHVVSGDGRDLSFQTFVNGKEIFPSVRYSAFVRSNKEFNKWIDITKFFVENNLDPSDRSIKNPDLIKKLKELGVPFFVGEAGKEQGQWAVQQIFYWKQRVEAKNKLNIRHKYAPLIGGYFALDSLALNEDRYCQDKYFYSGLAKILHIPNEALKFHADSAGGYYEITDGKYLLGEQFGGIGETTGYAEVGYILLSATTWSGPIQHFHLEIDKGHADLVSLCPPKGLHLRRKGNSFVGSLDNFTPTSDLNVLFVGGDAYSQIQSAYPNMAH